MLAKLLYLCTQPSETPVRRVTLYYAGLGAVVATLLWFVPGLSTYLTGDGSFLSGDGNQLIPVGVNNPVAGRFDVMVALIVSMTGALLLMLPMSWVYMATRKFTGYDQSIVQTMVILPLAIAGIVIMVKNSIALAFSLAGIVAGVRFRNSLRDTADALYIFAAIGVGLASGIGALMIAAVISVFFNYVILGLWQCDYGACPITGPKPEFSSGALRAAAGKPAFVKQKKKKKKTHEKVEIAEPVEGLV